jgi:hypothetical protein
MEARKLQALEMVVETFDALVSERGDTGKIWASLLKDTLKRRRPDFSETYYGFRTFGNLLEEAQTRGLFEFGRDEKSGTYVFRSTQAADEALGGVTETEPLQAAPEAGTPDRGDELAAETQGEQPSEIPAAGARTAPPWRTRGARARARCAEQAARPRPDGAGERQEDAGMASWPAPTPDLVEADDSASAPEAVQPEAADAADAAPEAAEQPAAAATKERRRAPRKPAARKGKAAQARRRRRSAPEAGADNAAIGADAVAAVEPAAARGRRRRRYRRRPDADRPIRRRPTAQAAKEERKKSTRPAHKAPSRKPAARARRPAKPKTPEGA